MQSYLFDKSKGWTVEKAKAWFEEHKPVKEHVQAILPFSVVEKIVDKPLRIRGVAMTAGMSRNFNIYTPEELQVFASKLVSAPVYVEHVSVGNAVGKVTKTEWDGQALWYEAEIYESDVADKIRKGLVQHVSVGADYEAIDVVDGMVPHGLHNAELSLVAVPGIPETNIQILERLRESFKGPVKERLKEQGDIACVFCGAPPDYLISVCQSCFDQFPVDTSAGPSVQSGVENLNEEELKKLVDEQVKKALKEQQTQEQPKDVVARAKNHFNKTDEEWNALSEEEKQSYISQLPPAGTKRSQEAEKTESLQVKLSETESKLADATTKLGEANKTIEELRKQVPGGGLLKDPPKTLPISEAVAVLEGLLPSPAVERSTMGMQRECQEIRNAIFQLKERVKSG